MIDCANGEFTQVNLLVGKAAPLILDIANVENDVVGVQMRFAFAVISLAKGAN